MKIITWNANMAFRKKGHLLMRYNPDIIVIPECEHPDKLKFSSSEIKPTDVVWHGNNINKGLGILSFGNYRLKIMKNHNDALRTILPILVTDGEQQFTLFAIWANNPLDKDYQYIGQVWKALHYYEDLIKTTSTILVGDFNSNTIWDKRRREGNHSSVVEKLASKGIKSTYHHYFDLMQSKEEHATFSMYRHKHRPYHIDYCFASSDFIENLLSVEVGLYDEWNFYSDHYPLIIQFKH